MSFVHCFDNAISSVYGSTVVTRRYLCHWLLGAECFFEPKQEPIVSLKNGNAVFYFFLSCRGCVLLCAQMKMATVVLVILSKDFCGDAKYLAQVINAIAFCCCVPPLVLFGVG